MIPLSIASTPDGGDDDTLSVRTFVTHVLVFGVEALGIVDVGVAFAALDERKQDWRGRLMSTSIDASDVVDRVE